MPPPQPDQDFAQQHPDMVGGSNGQYFMQPVAGKDSKKEHPAQLKIFWRHGLKRVLEELRVAWIKAGNIGGLRGLPMYINIAVAGVQGIEDLIDVIKEELGKLGSWWPKHVQPIGDQDGTPNPHIIAAAWMGVFDENGITSGPEEMYAGRTDQKEAKEQQRATAFSATAIGGEGCTVAAFHSIVPGPKVEKKRKAHRDSWTAARKSKSKAKQEIGPTEDLNSWNFPIENMVHLRGGHEDWPKKEDGSTAPGFVIGYMNLWPGLITSEMQVTVTNKIFRPIGQEVAATAGNHALFVTPGSDHGNFVVYIAPLHGKPGSPASVTFTKLGGIIIIRVQPACKVGNDVGEKPVFFQRFYDPDVDPNRAFDDRDSEACTGDLKKDIKHAGFFRDRDWRNHNLNMCYKGASNVQLGGKSDPKLDHPMSKNRQAYASLIFRGCDRNDATTLPETVVRR